ncbi:IclR family transcriptional regulator [Amycolatopsis thermophila]|uniref:DNA-binding IclR family transcriptional regulator n=1 Tax=Amycolatopsis thermophila TaxID=206084 RepID=A0ABU0F615_9PSEU|nr:IclR family transcriptional regulator [Amycolatopsis thermophila]MDQ0383029.1 DNA-binding IclR family transcriptional regulator [Amycolatopsis thermophila]
MTGTKSGADSARRALDMLFAFTEQKPSASVRELAETLDIPAPSAHRYVAMLRDMGLIEEGKRGRYHLTMRVNALARAARQATPLVDLAEPHMRRLAEQIGEAVLLIRLIGGQPVCFHRVETPSRFRLSFEPGQPLPMLRGASVRLLLGSMSTAERERYLDSALESGAQPPAHGREEFLREVERDRERGWSISNEEIDQGVWAASAAVYEGGQVVAAMSAPCPAFRMDDERRELVIELVRKAAGDLSHTLDPAFTAPGG